MSIKIMTRVWDNAPYESNKLLILLALADFADEDGQCWPSQAVLASKARCTVEYVRIATKAMVEAGHLEVMEEASGHKSKRYRLTPNLLGGGRSPQTVKGSDPKSAGGVTPNLTASSPKSAWEEPLEPSIEPSEDPLEGLIAENALLIQESKQLVSDDKWEILWDTYAYKVGKQQARKAFDKAVKGGANPDTLIAMAFRYVQWLGKHPDPPQQCHLATWINQERWNDELPEPRGKKSAGERRADANMATILHFQNKQHKEIGHE